MYSCIVGTLQQVSCHAGLRTSVIGVPKTIDGDLKNAQVATSFGFDTACKVRPCNARPTALMSTLALYALESSVTPSRRCCMCVYDCVPCIQAVGPSHAVLDTALTA